MKRKPLKRKTSLKRKPFPRKGRGFRIPKNKPPTGQQIRRKEELNRRRKLKAELLLECPTDSAGVRTCPKCKRRPDFRGLQLVHKIPLSRGGKTTRENCLIRCGPCHFGHDEPWSHRTEGKRRTLDNDITEALH
jgi:5-methylcytosine-specific restriction endonuclease McrA